MAAALGSRATMGGRAVRGGRCAPAGARGRAGAVAVRAAAAAVPVKTASGEAAGEATLDLKEARPEVANGLVHKYITIARTNARQGNASTLTRAEVSGGGKKPFAQKGTGRARQGSSRTPLKPGGGIIFGPKPRDWSQKMNAKEKRLSICAALSSAAPDMVVVDDLTEADFPAPKTKQFNTMLNAVGVSEEDSVCFIAAKKVDNVRKSAINIGRLSYCTGDNLRVYDVLNADKVVCEKGALDHINAFYGPEGGAWA